jgi:hypothetical protein
MTRPIDLQHLPPATGQVIHDRLLSREAAARQPPPRSTRCRHPAGPAPSSGGGVRPVDWTGKRPLSHVFLMVTSVTKTNQAPPRTLTRRGPVADARSFYGFGGGVRRPRGRGVGASSSDDAASTALPNVPSVSRCRLVT